jgi:hypothetical protein
MPNVERILRLINWPHDAGIKFSFNGRSDKMHYTVIEECGCYNVYRVDSNTPEEAKQIVKDGKAIAEHHCGKNEVVKVLSEDGAAT